MSETQPAKPTAAYVSFKTFTSFIETLSTKVVPHRVDRGLLPNMSGAIQSQLLVTLRYLGLMDKKDVVLLPLHDLVEAYGTDQWSGALKVVIDQSYSTISDHVHIESDTPAALYRAFREHGGTEGDTTKKAVRFFLKAMEEAKIEFSPHFKARGAALRSTNTRKKKTKKKPTSKGDNSATTEKHHGGGDQFPDGMQVVPLGGGRRIAVEADITPEDVTVIESMLPMLKAMANRHAKGGAS